MNKVTTEKTSAAAQEAEAVGSKFVNRGASDADFSQARSGGHLSCGSALILGLHWEGKLRCAERIGTRARDWVCIPLLSLLTVTFSCASCKNSSQLTGLLWGF